MTELTITIDEERLERLRKRAELLGTTVDTLALQGIDSILQDANSEFNELLQEMLAEDAELFKRLA